VRVVPAFLVKTLGVGARGLKNDRRDARNLSEVSCRIDLPSVHIPSKESRGRKSLCGARDALVATRTKLVNNVRGWLRAQIVRPRKGAIETLPARVRDVVVSKNDTVPAFVERVLKSIETLTEQIREADKELEQLAKADPTCRRLMTVPGVGPVTAVRFAAAIEDVGRFPTAHKLESYLGLVPGERSSGDTKQMLGITKAGSKQVRWCLVQACWVARRYRPDDPMVAWSLEVERRRGKRIAVVALARKLAGILYAIWRDGSTYEPRKGADPIAPLPPEPEIDLNQVVPITEHPAFTAVEAGASTTG